MAAARIGRIRIKAGDNVIAMRGTAVRNDRKTNFVNHAGSCFDSYVAATGQEPDALVVVLGGVKQTARCSWTVQGDSEGGAATMLAFAAAALNREFSS